MPKTLLVSNDLDMIRLAKLLQFLDFLGGEGIGGGNVGVAIGLEGVLGVERERIELALCHLRDEAFQIVHTDDGASADVVLPSANLEIGPVGDGRAGEDDFVSLALQEGLAVELLEALRGVEKSRVGCGFHPHKVAVDGQAVGLVLVFADAEVVGLDEFDEVLALDDPTRKLHFLAADSVQFLTKHRNDLADFGIGGVVGEDDILVPNKLAFSGFYLLRGREDVDVLRESGHREKAKDGEKFGFHCWKICAKIVFSNEMILILQLSVSPIRAIRSHIFSRCCRQRGAITKKPRRGQQNCRINKFGRFCRKETCN